ncbi:MAG: substrate-binding domain-containing protein [Candidatus Tectomicrobia bacterium]|nr:substrate-binding domain-containing protein [Candidatus Tectomicrobia bacterium]
MKARVLLVGLMSLALVLAAGAGRAAAKEFTLGVSLASDVNPFYIAMANGMKMQAKETGATLRFVTANEDMATQLNGVQDLIAAGVNLILISPIDAVASGAAYDAAAKANIPIMSIARGAKSEKQTAFIRMNEEQIGEEVGQWVVKQTGGKGNIAMLSGPAGASFAYFMAQGFKREIAKNPGLRIVAELHSGLTREEGLKLAEDVLTAQRDLAVIYAANDEIALGASQAVQAAKRATIKVTGLNGIPPAVMAVREGRMALTVGLNPVDWGKLGVKTAVDYLNGVKPGKNVYIRHLLIDSSNAQSIKLPPPPKK